MEKIIQFTKEHPWLVGSIVVLVLVLFLWPSGGGGSNADAITAAESQAISDAAQANATLQGQQIAANVQMQGQQLSANVQMQGQQLSANVALAQTQAMQDTTLGLSHDQLQAYGIQADTTKAVTDAQLAAANYAQDTALQAAQAQFAASLQAVQANDSTQISLSQLTNQSQSSAQQWAAWLEGNGLSVPAFQAQGFQSGGVDIHGQNASLVANLAALGNPGASTLLNDVVANSPFRNGPSLVNINGKTYYGDQIPPGTPGTPVPVNIA